MNALYQITLYSQMGPRNGTLSLTGSGSRITGILSLVGYENPVSGEWDEAGTLTLFHPLRTVVGEHVCRSLLTLSGTELTGTADLEGCRMHWIGTRIGPEGQEEARRGETR